MTPLFVDDAGLCKLLGVDRQTVAILQKRGLPPIDRAFGMHYVPAVRQFLDIWYGVGNALVPSTDSYENGWAARKPKKIRDVV